MSNHSSKNPEKLMKDLIGISGKIKDSSDIKIINSLKYDFCQLFVELQHLSRKQNFFWPYCNLNVYKFHFEERMNLFLTKNPEYTKTDFIELEIENIKNYYSDGAFHLVSETRVEYNFTHPSRETKDYGVNKSQIELLLDFLDRDVEQDLKINRRKKMQFLKVQKKNCLDESQNLIEQEQWHSEIFKSKEYFQLFYDFIKEANEKKFLREYSFIYRKMHDYEKPSMIHEHIKPGFYKTWFNENYPELPFLSEIRKDVNTDEREKRYKRLKNNMFKQHSSSK